MSATKWWSVETVAVVTGSNKGIGYAIVRALASEGLTVVLAARNEKLGLAATDEFHKQGMENVVFHTLEIASPESVAAFTNWINETYGGIDILVNNAGVYFPVNDYEPASLVIATNYFGTKNLTEALLPLLKSSAAGARIVTVSAYIGQLQFIQSETLRKELRDPREYTVDTLNNIAKKYLEAAKSGTAEADGYTNAATVSKALLNAYFRLLAIRLSDRPDGEKIYVNLADPGLVKTDLNPDGTLTIEEGGDTAAWLALLPPNGPSGFFFAERKEISF